MSKIKGLRQKTENGYSDFIPFGTDGNLVDMANGLILEEELILGGNHITSFTETENSTVITELFKDKDTNNNIIYTVQTTITESENSTNITIELYNGSIGDNDLIRSKIITIPVTGNITETLGGNS